MEKTAEGGLEITSAFISASAGSISRREPGARGVLGGGGAGRGRGWLLEPAVDSGPDAVRGRAGEALGCELGCGPVRGGMRACGVGDHRVVPRCRQAIGALACRSSGSGAVEVGGAGTRGASG